MSLTLAVIDQSQHAVHYLAAPASLDSGKALSDALRKFIGPLVLFAVGIVALSFLVQRQMTQFFQFVAIAVGVGVFFYAPGIVPALANVIAGIFGVTGASGVQ